MKRSVRLQTFLSHRLVGLSWPCGFVGWCEVMATPLADPYAPTHHLHPTHHHLRQPILDLLSPLPLYGVPSFDYHALLFSFRCSIVGEGQGR